MLDCLLENDEVLCDPIYKKFTWTNHSFFAENDEGYFTVTCDVDFETTVWINENTKEEDSRDIDFIKVKNCEITEVGRWYTAEHGSLTENAKAIEDYINSQKIADILEWLEIDENELFN